MSEKQLRIKRLFDLTLVVMLLPLLLLPIIVLIVAASIDTKNFGVFTQLRVGQNGKLFKIYKIRTLKDGVHRLGHLEKSATPLGKYLRKTKLDELPQLFNVLKGDMSFVGPRPDIQGFADMLEGKDQIILKVKPGITGEATIKYRDEELVLERQNDPEDYNRTIIWVDKVKINRNYVENYSFYLDLRLILKSL
ncbi:sugar transferase [Winogradskyella flava]|uniref:Sugar transferase n=1 Tax=Winogradskyella flava TaxID=1884876 RepID=A0A842IZC4_9FLAO|nr:sugar transferase [Winogradskyella flava]